LIQSLLIIFFAPWIGIFVNQAHEVEKSFWIPRPGIYTLVKSFWKYCSSSGWLLALFMMLSGLAALTIKKRQVRLDRRHFFEILKKYTWNISSPKRQEIYFLLVWLLVPVILPFVVSLFSQPIYLTRYTIVASVALFILVAAGISNLSNTYIKERFYSCFYRRTVVHKKWRILFECEQGSVEGCNGIY
jgi:hypothetical protein